MGLRPPPCSPGNLRRREASTPLDAIAGVNGAYVPGVLTAAGVTGAFGAIYAAHALYAFIDAKAAFPALGIVALAAMAAAMLHGPALGRPRPGRRAGDAAARFLGAAPATPISHSRRPSRPVGVRRLSRRGWQSAYAPSAARRSCSKAR